MPGVELSTVLEDRDLHVLGYFIDARRSGVLTEEVRWLREMRLERILEMAAKARELGYPVDEEQLRHAATTSSVGTTAHRSPDGRLRLCQPRSAKRSPVSSDEENRRSLKS